MRSPCREKEKRSLLIPRGADGFANDSEKRQGKERGPCVNGHPRAREEDISERAVSKLKRWGDWNK